MGGRASLLQWCCGDAKPQLFASTDDWLLCRIMMLHTGPGRGTARHSLLLVCCAALRRTCAVWWRWWWWCAGWVLVVVGDGWVLETVDGWMDEWVK